MKLNPTLIKSVILQTNYILQIRHPDPVIKPERLYAVKALDLIGKGGLENIRKRKNMLRKILPPDLSQTKNNFTRQ